MNVRISQPPRVAENVIAVTVSLSPFETAYQWHKRLDVPVLPIEGKSLQWLVENAPDLKRCHWDNVVVAINGDIVDRGLWPRVRPRASWNVVVEIAVVPKGEDGFNILSLAVNITAAFAGFSNPLVGIGIALVGGAIISAFRPKAKGDNLRVPEGPGATQNRSAGTSINALSPFEQIPAVIGKMRVTLPLLNPAWTAIENEDQKVFMLFGLQGRHKWEEIELNGIDTDEQGDTVEIETREGTVNDAALTLITQTVVQQKLDMELGDWDVVPDLSAGGFAWITLADQTNPTTSRPTQHYVTSGDGPDEIVFDFLMPNGMSGPGVDVGTALEIETKLKGDVTWRALPYVKLQMVDRLQLFRFAIHFKFEGDPSPLPTNQGEPWDEILHTTNTPEAPLSFQNEQNNANWSADSYFGTGSPLDALHVAEFQDRIEVYLDPAASPGWAKGQYEFRFRKGYTQSPIVNAGQNRYHLVFDESPGGAPGPPGYITSANAPSNTVVGKMFLSAIRSVWNDDPVVEDEIAKVAIVATNTQVNSVTALASGYTEIFSNGVWDEIAVTSNPAAWYRRALLDKFNARPLPDNLIDDVALGTWYDFCETEGLEVNAIIEGGTTIEDVLNLCAVAGRAKTLRASKWGVWIDQDRSADPPKQMFTPRNSQDFTVDITYDEIPDILRMKYFDSADEYRQKEVLVDSTGTEVLPENVTNEQLIESIEATGKVTTAEVLAHGKYLLLQMQKRTARFGFNAAVESLHSTRGDLVGLGHDVVSRTFGMARVVSVTTSGASPDQITGLVLDSELPLSEHGEDFFAPTDFFAASDFFDLDNPSGIWMRFTDDQVVTKQINETDDTNTITFTTPFSVASATGLKPGVLIGSGPLNSEFRRLIIENIEPTEDFHARIIAVDEAPDIHT